MCGPIPFMIASIAASAVSVYATNQSAKAQSSAMKAQAETERLEQNSATEEAMGQRIRAARESRARARVASGESGAMGASFAAAANQSLQDQSMDSALASKNLAFQQRSVDDRLATGLSQIRRVSAVEAGLNIGMAGAQGYSAGLEIQKARKGD